MRATLEYTLPDESDDFRAATQGANWREVVRSFAEYLRSQEKYHDATTRDDIATMREWLFEEITGRGLSLD